MTGSRHTPGPLTVTQREYAPGDRLRRTALINDEKQRLIAAVFLPVLPAWGLKRQDEQAANSSLFAAAPEMLAALEAELEPYEGRAAERFIPETARRINMMRDAVAKARA